MNIQCPNCKTNQIVSSNYIISLVCRSCKRLLFTDPNKSVASFQVDEPYEDMTPLRIGTTGTINDIGFEIKGRIQYHFNLWYGNYWFLLLKNNNWAWLYEAYGAFAIFYPADYTLKTKDNRSVRPGKSLKIAADKYLSISSIADCTGCAAEGELPNKFIPFVPFVVIEANNEKKELVSFHIKKDNKQEAFYGRFMEFDDFEFKNLRNLNEWK